MNRLTRITFSIAVGVFLIWFLFKGTDWHAVYASISGVRIHWLVLAQVFAWSSYFIRVQRWSYVIRASHPATTFRSMFSATQIGFLVNFTVPARVGEVVRAYVLARLAKLPFVQSLTMVALDRVNDVLGLLIVIFIALLSFPVSKDITFAPGVFSNTEPFAVSSGLIRPVAASLTIFLCVILGILILLYVNQPMVLRLIDVCAGVSQKLASWLRKLFLGFAAGMHVFRSAVELAKSVCLSLLTWGANVLSAAAVLHAFNIDFPWGTPFLMIAMIAVFISFPVAPGAVGQYHIAVVACLLSILPETNLDEAKAIAIVAHGLSLVPIAFLGIFCLLRERLSFPNLTRLKT